MRAADDLLPDVAIRVRVKEVGRTRRTSVTLCWPAKIRRKDSPDLGGEIVTVSGHDWRTGQGRLVMAMAGEIEMVMMSESKKYGTLHEQKGEVR